MTHTRYFPKGAIKVIPKNMDVEIGLYDYQTKNGKNYFGFIAYSGKRGKHDLYEAHTSATRRDERIKEYFANIEKSKQWKSDRAEKRILKSNPLKVGDILYTSWGYDQTNVDFFQVLEVKDCFCHIKQIHGEYVEGTEGRDCSHVTAVKNSFIERKEIQRKKILTSDGGKSIYLKINESATAWLWDGRPKYSSWYA